MRLPSFLGFPGSSSGKELACQCRRDRDAGLIPGLGRSPGGGHVNPLQYSCLENPVDRGARQTIVHRITKSQTQLKQLSTHASSFPTSFIEETILSPIEYSWLSCKLLVVGGYVCAKLLQSSLTLCNLINCSLPGSSGHGILQARILQWVAMSPSRESSQLRDRTSISYFSLIGRQVIYH